MPRHRAAALWNLPWEACLPICRMVARHLGWRITSESSTWVAFVEERQNVSLTAPVTVTVMFFGTGPMTTRLVLDVSSMGPLQSSYVKQQADRVGQLLEQTAARLPGRKVASRGQVPLPQGPCSRSFVVNGVRLSDAQLQALERTYHTRFQNGRYWYDHSSGAWGVEGGPGVGVIPADLPIGGPLRADASNGDTGFFVNGRELHSADVAGLKRIWPAVFPGRYWIDARTNYGIEGGQLLGNLQAQLQARVQAQAMSLAGGGVGGPWSVSSGGTTVGGDGQGFMYASVSGSSNMWFSS
ncbi:hypothetical protein [Hyalangium rubrum]|uniref:Uncharacterized protein n=1 Tax=Hyalangium rubrum TaxID=3103134 RepID=A0ABU5HCI8_9BACT|nr:hypothetical protein [Hyalangium sp. s54d21]MDY7231186.1 hypothetical protein [Hyalangium sp. s54d21]